MSIVPTPKLKELLDKSPSDIRITEELIDSRIKAVSFLQLPNSTTTICNVLLDNGYSVRGESACVDAKNFNADVGQTIALRRAKEKLWPLFGFMLAELRFRASIQAEEQATFDTMMDQHEAGEL